MNHSYRLPVAALAVGLVVAGCAHSTKSADTTETTTAASTSVPSAADARATLRKLLPAGYPPESCTPGVALGGAVAAVACGKNSDGNGPPSATYTLFADVGTLRLSFDSTVQSSAVTDCPGRIQSPGAWHHTATANKSAGMLMCGSSQGHPIVVWTNDDALLLSVARADRSGLTLEQLYAWWSSHS